MVQIPILETQKRYSDFEGLRAAIAGDRRATSSSLPLPVLPEKKLVGTPDTTEVDV